MSLPAPVLPPVGFGCSPYRHGARVDLAAAVDRALDVGYRLLDGAEVYGNERAVGDVLRRRRAPPRTELVLVSKLWSTNHAYRDVIAACERSLRALGVDYLDLYLVHSRQALAHRESLATIGSLAHDEAVALAFPRDEKGNLRLTPVPLAETWSAMESLVDRGLARAIGVSNFGVEQLTELLSRARIRPAVNQIEHHPYRRQVEALLRCRDEGIAVMAHSPLSSPGLLADPTILALAANYRRTPAQIVLRWNVQSGVIPLPSSTDPAHIAANLDLFGFALAPEDVAALDGLAR